jgi:hypothetical protein
LQFNSFDFGFPDKTLATPSNAAELIETGRGGSPVSRMERTTACSGNAVVVVLVSVLVSG